MSGAVAKRMCAIAIPSWPCGRWRAADQGSDCSNQTLGWWGEGTEFGLVYSLADLRVEMAWECRVAVHMWLCFDSTL